VTLNDFASRITSTDIPPAVLGIVGGVIAASIVAYISYRVWRHCQRFQVQRILDGLLGDIDRLCRLTDKRAKRLRTLNFLLMFTNAVAGSLLAAQGALQALQVKDSTLQIALGLSVVVCSAAAAIVRPAVREKANRRAHRKLHALLLSVKALLGNPLNSRKDVLDWAASEYNRIYDELYGDPEDVGNTGSDGRTSPPIPSQRPDSLKVEHETTLTKSLSVPN
jgi:hypothetical protein